MATKIQSENKDKDKNPLGFVLDYKPQNLILREESPVDEFYQETVTPSFDCDTAVACVNPLYVLFYAQKIEKAGSFAVEKWLEQLDSASKRFDSLKELRSQCSDEELLQFMKSRYIQQPCEVEAWASYINENYDKMSTEIKEYIAANNQSSEHIVSEQSTQNSE